METKKLVCPDCGDKFTVEIDGDNFNPSACPQCGMAIGSVDRSPTSDDDVAQPEV